MMPTGVERTDRLVLLGLQALIIGVPLLLGGMQDDTLTFACPIVLALLAVTLWRRRQATESVPTPGLAPLAAFMAFGIFTTVPLPPSVIGWFAPTTEALYRATLPGWPGGGGWSTWRSIAIDPWAVWIELLRFAIGFGAYAVIIAYPWADTPRGEPGRARAFRVLFLTLGGAGVSFALIAFAQEAAGNGRVLWVWPAEASHGRLAGPFVNPNHLAAWLELALPAVAAYSWTVARRVEGRLRAAAHSGRMVGVRARRAWAASLIANQGRLWTPLVTAAVAVVMFAAHLATDSRGGRVGLMAAALVVGLGVLARNGPRRGRDLVRRHAVALVVGILLVTNAAIIGLSGAAGESDANAGLQDVDVNMSMRLAVARQGVSVFSDHLLVGTGLGSWIHAFRPYQRPPVEDGIWDHAHNDYVELGAESGVVGLGLALLFGLAVLRGSRRDAPAEEPQPRSRRHSGGGANFFEEGDWRAALRDTRLIRWGLAAGVLAILVHSSVDFSLRMPANLLALMVVLGLLTLTGTPRPRAWVMPGPALLLALTVLVAAMPITNALRLRHGALPLSPESALEAADSLASEEGDRPGAEVLVRVAIDRSPANRDAHEALADVLDPGPESEAALRRAIALDPWAPELRDKLGLQLWERGDRVHAAAELEESMLRYPHLETHAYLDPDSGIFPPENAEQLRRELVEGDTMSVRLALLPDEMADGIERGLRRALDDQSETSDRAAVAQDLIALLEARSRWSEAASALRAQGSQRLDDTEVLARAARNYLKVRDYTAAEETLLTALRRAPDEGVLYRKLAVDVYAARGDFQLAETILDAGERNAIDLVPVYRGVTEVLARREAQQPPPITELHLTDGEGSGEPAEEE